MFADYIVQTICEVLGIEMPPERIPEPKQREPDDEHGPFHILIGVCRSARDSFYRFLEKPGDPLSPEQIHALRDLEQKVEGLCLYPDKLSLQKGTSPCLLYAGFGSTPYIGTAYGSRFDSLDGAREDAVLSDVIRQIEDAAYDNQTS
ncbi:hypothetical protein JW898_02050 [Candidatus Woesearchaeota archaeon]|nr:hypothetical protein [Candidatus Woesearchaeota archaeon]